MRKFTLLFAFLLSLVGVTQAQTVVTDLANLSNDKLYVLSSGTGTLQVNDAGDGLVAVATADNTNPKQQFSILKSYSGTYHLFHPATGKYVSGTSLGLSGATVAASVVTFVAHEPGGTASGKFMIKDDDNYYNIDGDRNLAVNSWSTHDNGNGFTITEVGTLDAEVQAAAEQWIQSPVSTAEAPKCYAIKNIRHGSYVSAQLSSGNRLSLTTALQPEGFFYFTDASAAAEGTLPDGAKAVYVHNLSTNKVLAGHTQNPWGDTGIVYYIVPAKSINTNNTNGYVLTKSATDFSEGSSWNNFQNGNTQVGSWNADDVGSVWLLEYQTADDLSTTLTSALNELKTAAIAEAEAEGARPYYACSEENIEACKTTINSQTATTYEEYVTAKTNITNAPSTLRATERIKPLQGGETIIIHNRKNAQRYITTNAAEESADTAVSLVKGKATVDTRSLWIVVAVENGKFKLCNALSRKYIQHQGDDNLALVNAENATAYAFINQENHWVLIDAGDVDYRHINIRDWNGAEGVAGWTDENDLGNHWEIIAPTSEQLARLVELQTPIETLKIAAKEEINNKTLEGINAGVEFYTITEEAFNACKLDALALIEAATTHAELDVAKVQAQQLFDNLWTATNNRANALTAGIKVKFLNKEVNTNYMTTDANGATTSSEVTTASVWELVANDEATGYYLYNNLSGKYLKHAAQNGGQATLVAKTEATLYNVQPKGVYVVMGEVVPTSDRAYVHCDDPSYKITRYTEESDRSLWTVTSATPEELTQLNTEIQTNITTQLDAAVAAANAVVDPYKALEYYKPQAAITTYDAAIAAAKDGVDTYDELAAALDAITAAQAAFEAAVAADDVELSNTVGDGTRIKLRNRLHSEYWMSAIDGKVGMKSATDASSIWTLKAAADGGFYLLNPLTNKYVKHIDGDDTKFELVEGTENASVYYVHSSGLYVTVGRLAEQSKDTESREYLHGVNWHANGNGQWVVRWNAVGEASHWTLASVTDDEVDALNNAITTEASAQWEAYKAKAQATVDAYAALPYFTATEAAVTAYNEAVAKIGEVATYLGLSNGKKMLDDALNAFLAADRSASNPVQDGDQIRLVNKHAPTFYMTTDANGVDAYADNSETNYVSSTIWTAVGNSTDGYKLYNPLKNCYIVHPTGNGVQAALVEDAAQATLYDIVPNGLYVNITLKEVGEEGRPCLHFGTENHVTKFTASDARSLWGIFKATEAEKTQLPADIEAYVKATITAAQEEALQNANAADDFAYYACSAENVAIAVAAINAVSTEIATHEQLSEGLAAINAALETLYASERTAGPAVGDRIRFINRYFTTHYLGYNSTGLAHYEPNTADDATENLPSTTIWELEESEEEGQFYLKNYLLGLYACFETYNSNSQIVLRQEKNHPVKLMQKETIDGMWYFDIETQNTEVNGSYKSVHATNNGSTVQGHPDNYGSHWMITRATDEDLKSVNLTAQLSALIDFILKPVIEEAKRYYYVDAEGQVVNNFVDDVKAGYYTYTGDGTWDTYKESYVNDINRCISISENIGGTNSDQVHAGAELLRANIAKFSLNLPRTNGFFRLKCVYNDQYLQADANRQTFALNEETGKASIFYLEAKGNGDDANTSLGTLVSYDQGLYFTQGKSGGIYAKLQPIGTAGDTFSFTIPANNTFGSYNISSASGDNKRYLYGNAVERTEWQVIDGDSVEVKYYRADNGDNATVAIQGDTNNNGYNWVMERVDTIPVTISAVGWATFYAPIAMGIPEGVKAYICTGMDSNYELTLVELSEVIPAGTAVLLEGAAGTHLFIDMEHEVTAETQSTENNYLRGVLAKTWRDPSRQNLNQDMTSEEGRNVNIDYPVESGKVYTLGLEDGKVAMYRYAGNQFRHFCSYLDLPAESTAGLDVLRFGKIEGPTAIEEAPVISLEDAVIYDLSGRRVAEPGKGVYIVNGKKVYFK